jgi:hypothetical protein
VASGFYAQPCLRGRKPVREITGSTLGATEFASIRPIGSEKRSARYGCARGCPAIAHFFAAADQVGDERQGLSELWTFWALEAYRRAWTVSWLPAYQGRALQAERMAGAT